LYILYHIISDTCTTSSFQTLFLLGTRENLHIGFDAISNVE